MERIYKLIVNQEDLTIAEKKMENEEMNRFDFIEFEKDYENFISKSGFDISDNEFLVVCDDVTLGRLISFMLRGDVKTTNIQDVTNDMFYNKIDITGAEESFLEAVKNCLIYKFETDDVLDKMIELGGEKCLTETDKLIIEKGNL